MRSASGIDLLHVNLDELRKAVLVEVQDQVVHEVEAVADDDERELVLELGFFEEVLDFLRVVEIALATDTLNRPDLTSTRGSLNVLKVDFGILAQVNDRAKIIVQPCNEIRSTDELRLK